MKTNFADEKPNNLPICEFLPKSPYEEDYDLQHLYIQTSEFAHSQLGLPVNNMPYHAPEKIKIKRAN